MFLFLQGMDHFQTRMNIEVQWASEAVIAAVERNGGTITTAYYDPVALGAVCKPMALFKRGAFTVFIRSYEKGMVCLFFIIKEEN